MVVEVGRTSAVNQAVDRASLHAKGGTEGRGGDSREEQKKGQSNTWPWPVITLTSPESFDGAVDSDEFPGQS